MKFKPKQPRDGINVSDEHPLVEASTLILGLSAIFVAIALVVVFFIEVALLFIPTEKEAELFSGWAPGDMIALEIEDDAREIETRVLLKRLTRHMPDSPYEFRLEVSESEVPNAMAFPGGLIVVTTALLDMVESENELAFVLGHELGHYENRDHIRQLGRGIILGILFAAIGGYDGGANLGITIADLTLRGFSREQESNADTIALSIVYAEYDHVNGSWRFFDRLMQEDPDNFEMIVYLSSHPDMAERIEDIKTYAQQHGWPLTGTTTSLVW